MRLDARWHDGVMQFIQLEEEASKMRICEYLRGQIQQAFRYAHLRFPHWTELRFGNGTFVVIGMTDEEERQLCYRAVPRETRAELRERRAAETAKERLGVDLRPFEIVTYRKWCGPIWLKHLFSLCEEYAARAVDDIYPTE